MTKGLKIIRKKYTIETINYNKLTFKLLNKKEESICDQFGVNEQRDQKYHLLLN